MKNEKIISPNSRIISQSPFLDIQGLLRAQGRVEYLPDKVEKFQPLILDAKHEVTQLLIKHYHEKLFHKNHETVINELQKNYWIIGLRKILRSLVNKCSICRMLRGTAFNPKMANLPPDRLACRFRPFTHCGLDYFGPIWVKIGRRREKRWGPLFTCMTTRAVHLELAHTLSADSAILAIQRFAARRGFPQILYSDNGTNFKGASQETKLALLNLDKDQ